MSLYVDARHVGHFGIGRYAAEVLPRLGLAHRPLDLRRDPMSPLAPFERGWRRPGPTELIYSPGFWTGRSRARQVLTLHDLIHLRGRGPGAVVRRAYYERLVRPAVERAGHVLTVTETSADDIRGWLGPGVAVHVTGNACSEAFTPDGPAHEAERPYVLFVGTAKPHKNAGLLMRALAELPEHDLLCVSGDVAELAALAVAHGVGHRVRVRTGLDDAELARLYRGAAVLAQPSTLEGFGLPALEAICCGTPVAHLRGCRAVAEVVGSDGVGGEDDPVSYAAALLAAAALGRVTRERPDWSDVAHRVRDALLAVDPGLERDGA